MAVVSPEQLRMPVSRAACAAAGQFRSRDMGKKTAHRDEIGAGDVVAHTVHQFGTLR